MARIKKMVCWNPYRWRHGMDRNSYEFRYCDLLHTVWRGSIQQHGMDLNSYEFRYCDG